MKASILVTALAAAITLGIAGCASRTEKTAAVIEPAPTVTYTAPAAPPAQVAVPAQTAPEPVAAAPAAPAAPAADTTVAVASPSMERPPQADRN
jgi:hypothetical protein